jgi:hypothetical protein
MYLNCPSLQVSGFGSVADEREYDYRFNSELGLDR